MGWVKRLVDRVIQKRMGHKDLEFSWSQQESLDAKDRAVIISTYVKDGIQAINEARSDLGLDPVEGGDDPMIFLPTGPVLVKDIEQMSAQQANPPPPPQPGGNVGEGGAPGKEPEAPAGGKAPTGPNGKAPQAGGRAQKAAAKTLYVTRRLKNTAEVRTWAKAQGFGSTIKPTDMHVTIAFSQEPVDWDDVGDSFDIIRVPGADNRTVEPLGDKGAVVLRFQSEELTKRWQQIKDVGASWDYTGYKPHVTISYSGAPADLSSVQPYAGELIFGPEQFAEIEDDWADHISELEVGKAGRAAAVAKGHVAPENAEPVSLPLADPIIEADVQHIAWQLVRDGKTQTQERSVPIADLVATQPVVDRERVARDAADYRDHGQTDEMPLVIDGDVVDGSRGKYFIVAGHHHAEGAARAGATRMRVQVMGAEPEVGKARRSPFRQTGPAARPADPQSRVDEAMRALVAAEAQLRLQADRAARLGPNRGADR
jgi:hypothetical protein